MPTTETIESIVASLPDLCDKAGYSEIWGVDLSGPSDPAKLIAAKYLKAHNDNVNDARSAIEQTLAWRKDFRPRAAAFEEVHDAKFDGMGHITQLGEDVVTWNIYGAAAKDPAALFEPLDQFLRWRVGLQERSVALLRLDNYVGDGMSDTKKGIQIHDYLNVSFFRMDSTAKAGSKATIDLMSKYYPETMKRKLFVNVPVVMGWMFATMRLILSRETVRKFTVLSYGSQVAVELGHADQLPKEYGGTAEHSLKELGKQETAPVGPTVIAS